MYDVKSLVVLLKLFVVVLVATIWALRTYWQNVDRNVVTLVFLSGYFCGVFGTTIYFLVRHRRELTSGEVQE